MREFIRDNVAFVAKGSLLDSLNQKCTIVEYYPSQSNEDMGKCYQIMMDLDEAEKLDIPQVFALTYQVDFFEKMGFVKVKKEELPHKIWSDCLNCVKFPDCDEVSLLWTSEKTRV